VVFLFALVNTAGKRLLDYIDSPPSSIGSATLKNDPLPLAAYEPFVDQVSGFSQYQMRRQHVLGPPVEFTGNLVIFSQIDPMLGGLCETDFYANGAI